MAAKRVARAHTHFDAEGCDDTLRVA